MKQYCDITDWCNDSLSDSLSESLLSCYTDTDTNILHKVFFYGSCPSPLIAIIVKETAPDCPTCKNDSWFTFLVDSSEILTLQFIFSNLFNFDNVLTHGWKLEGETNYYIEGDVIDCCNASAITTFDTVLYDSKYYVAKHKKTDLSGNAIYFDTQGVKLNVAVIPYDCFYLRLKVYDTLGNYTTYYTQPYTKVNCMHRDYVTIESSYSDKDLMNNIYTEPDTIYPAYQKFFTPDNKITLRGEYKLTSIVTEKNFVKDFKKQIDSRVNYRYRLRLYPLPEDAIRILANVVNGNDVTINDEIVIIDGNIEKESDTMNDWTPEIYFKTYSEIKDFGCE